ncbi:hypothetical protein HanXRQr2_Chr03g0116231 [Helianthus annuus]|uniref:Uncharacterized protein n=1 Tax=Helianthus annuus TaxID=4232 RepID=A0A9K3JH55_HELAN|nr:hypothetical protein HanXRQr2_Chr03g0116231 [Helianthus annuus]KAJ0944129.1 hypothetical protein HanPSC8_Chr03g0112661 [Helianthus annuus]
MPIKSILFFINFFSSREKLGNLLPRYFCISSGYSPNIAGSSGLIDEMRKKKRKMVGDDDVFIMDFCKTSGNVSFLFLLYLITSLQLTSFFYMFLIFDYKFTTNFSNLCGSYL